MDHPRSRGSRIWHLLPFVCLLAVLRLVPFSEVWALSTETPPEHQPQAKNALQSVDMVARFPDDSRLRLKVNVDKIELRTPYGTLRIPVKDIKKIELATRISPAERKQIAAAIRDLGSKAHGKRETAMSTLLKLKEKGYSALMEAQKHPDPEVVQRATLLLQKLRVLVPRDILKVRAKDVVYTADSKIAGEIMNPSIKVGTNQFGPQELKLHQLHSLLLPGLKKPEHRNVLPDPGSLSNHRGQVGMTFYFRVTGQATGAVWGSDEYTTDSTLAVAAVHAGAIKLGTTGVVKVTIVAPPPQFQGTTRNGVTTGAWGAYPAAYRVEPDDNDE